MRSAFKTACSGLFIALGCLCFSQAKAPKGYWDHLYEGIPLLVGKRQAWLVQEPRVIATGKVVHLDFGPGENEAFVLSTSHVPVTAEEALDPSAKNAEPLRYRASIVNLSSGSVKSSISLPRMHPVACLGWDGEKRLYQLVESQTGRAVTIDLKTGQFFQFQDEIRRMPLPSKTPHLALFARRDIRQAEEDIDRQVVCDLVDFSLSPPRHRALTMPKVMRNPIGISAKGLLLSRDAVCLNLSTGETRRIQPDENDLEKMEMEARTRSSSLHIPWGSVQGKSLEALDGGPRPSMLLSREAAFAEINEKETKVLFIAHETGFVVELAPIDLAKAIKSLLDQARQKAIMNAKMAGTAAMIYAADYDGCLPATGSQAAEGLMPYLRNPDILARINWTNLTGQNIDGLNNRSGTVLGYYPAPGGRAVLYADCHVEWAPDP